MPSYLMIEEMFHENWRNLPIKVLLKLGKHVTNYAVGFRYWEYRADLDTYVIHCKTQAMVIAPDFYRISPR